MGSGAEQTGGMKSGPRGSFSPVQPLTEKHPW